MPFIPHTDEDIQEMLAEIGVDNIESLYSEIPSSLRLKKPLNIPEGMNEFEMTRHLKQRLQNDHTGLCFIGAGAYEHHIPAAVFDLVSRGEYLTAYTPYQAEASQGNLQLIYEFQTMVASLMGMDVANASIYDGATALAEAVLMAVRSNKDKPKRILLSTSIHPAYLQTVKTVVENQEIELIDLNFDAKTGAIDSAKLNKDKDIAAIVIQQPNFFGMLEDVDSITNWAHQQGALVIAVTNPIAVALVKEPGQWGEKGADIACGEAQPLGISLSSGGPYCGFMACKKQYVRQMPGRIVGRTVDVDGKEGFTLTLQAREQHIRRSKATSNICTNQGLMVTAATIYMSLLGPVGLKRVAMQSHHNAVKLYHKLLEIEGVEQVFSGPFFHEFVVRLKTPVHQVLHLLARYGIQGGFDLTQFFPELGNALLVCVTETKTESDLEIYRQTLQRILNEDKTCGASSCFDFRATEGR